MLPPYVPACLDSVFGAPATGGIGLGRGSAEIGLCFRLGAGELRAYSWQRASQSQGNSRAVIVAFVGASVDDLLVTRGDGTMGR